MELQTKQDRLGIIKCSQKNNLFNNMSYLNSYSVIPLNRDIQLTYF